MKAVKIIAGVGIASLAAWGIYKLVKSHATKTASSAKTSTSTEPAVITGTELHRSANGVVDTEQEIYSQFLGIGVRPVVIKNPKAQGYTSSCAEGCTKIYIKDGANSHYACDCGKGGIKDLKSLSNA